MTIITFMTIYRFSTRYKLLYYCTGECEVAKEENGWGKGGGGGRAVSLIGVERQPRGDRRGGLTRFPKEETIRARRKRQVHDSRLDLNGTPRPQRV